jgi:hypothetical protein
MENIDLIGKKIYKSSNYGIDSLVGEIERVTATTAIIRHYKFRLPLVGRFREIGNSERWSIYFFELESPELNEQWAKKNAISDIKKMIDNKNITQISLDNLLKAKELLSPVTTLR